MKRRAVARSRRLPLLGALIVGLFAPHLVHATGGVRAAPPGQITAAPDGVSQMELVVFDPALAPALLAVPLEGTVRIDDWPVAPGLRRALVVARHDVYAPDARIVAVDHGREVEVPRSLQVFLWGSIEDEPGSTVMVALDPEDQTVSGFTMSADGNFDLLPPAADRPGHHLVAAPASLRRPGEEAPSFACGQGDLPANGRDRQGRAESPTSSDGIEPRLPGSPHTAVLAIDTDNEAMGTKFSNNTTVAANWMAQAVAGMSAISSSASTRATRSSGCRRRRTPTWRTPAAAPTAPSCASSRPTGTTATTA